MNKIRVTTMAKNFFNLIFMLIFVSSLLGQNQQNEGLCVINMTGAKVFEEPSFNSKELGVIPVGEVVIPEGFINTNEKFTTANQFSLTGHWIKPKDVDGFLFSSDLTSKDVEIQQNIHGQTSVNLLGKLIGQKEEKKMIMTDNGEFPQYVEYKYYENGTYTYSAWDGCFDHITEYKNLTFTEVYHQMVSDYGALINETDFWIPTYQGQSGNTIRFAGDGATEDLKIELKDNGTIIVASYDCT